MLRLPIRVTIILLVLTALLITLCLCIGTTHSNDRISFIAEFDNQTDIYLYDPLHSELINITDSAYPEWSFAWSSSGALLYTASIDAAQTGDALLVMNRLGDEERIDTPDTLFSFGNVWSPDGTTLAYYSSHPRNVSDLYTISFPDLRLRNLTQTDTISETNPLWSPDGESLLYRIQGDLYRLHIATGESEILMDLDASPIENPVWSPDGTLIAFYIRTWMDRGNVIHAFTISPNGDNLHQLQLPLTINSPITWSPDSQQIALIANDSELLIYNIPTDTYFRVTGDNRRFAPAWSPDARWIAFIENRQLHLYDNRTGDIHILVTDEGQVKAPLLWQP